MARPSEYSPAILEKAEAYLQGCATDKSLPQIAGFALYLGIHRDTVYDWAKLYPEFSDIVKQILSSQELALVDKGLKGEYNASIVKLMLTKHGYTDKQDVTSGDKPIAPLLVRFLDESAHSGDTEGV